MQQEKLAWAKSLKVGDVVCDCRFQHLRIANIVDDTTVKFPRWLREVLFSDWMPLAISIPIDSAFCRLSRKLGNIEVTDRTLVLEDGAQCSAMHCCDAADHTWLHPEKVV